MGLLDNLLATGANIAGIEKARDDLLTAGTQAQTGAQTIGTQAQTATQFQPFAVTGAYGGATTTPQGSLTLALTPEQQALQTSLFGTASGLAGQLGQFDQAGREQDVYSRLRAMQAPEEERQRLALEQRLLGQGRLGVKTAQYGGTPEQFAMAKAQTEAQNQAGMLAMQQALAERQQGITDVQGLMKAGYAPENQLLNAFQAAVPVAELADVGRRAGAEQYSEAAMSGLQALLQSRQTAADLSQQYYNSLASLAGSQNQSGMGMISQILSSLGGNASNIPEWVQGLIGGIGGGGGSPFGSNLYDVLGDQFSVSDYLMGGDNYNAGNAATSNSDSYLTSGLLGTPYDPYAQYTTGS
jgi:hypothetical protein